LAKNTDLEIIDKLAIGPRIWDMAFNKAETPGKIGELLRSEGLVISDLQVSKWIRQQANKHGGELSGYISRHIRRHLPDDLAAIEKLEEASLKNAAKNFTHKIKDISQRDELVEFIEKKIFPLLRAADTIETDAARKNELRNVAQTLLKQCADWTLDELKWLSSQREERKIALDAIEIKLKYAQNLRMNSGARINIIQSQIARSAVDGEVQTSPKIVRISRSQTFGSDNS
jgi:hypothetical protein